MARKPRIQDSARVLVDPAIWKLYIKWSEYIYIFQRWTKANSLPYTQAHDCQAHETRSRMKTMSRNPPGKMNGTESFYLHFYSHLPTASYSVSRIPESNTKYIITDTVSVIKRARLATISPDFWIANEIQTEFSIMLLHRSKMNIHKTVKKNSHSAQKTWHLSIRFFRSQNQTPKICTFVFRQFLFCLFKTPRKYILFCPHFVH